MYYSIITVNLNNLNGLIKTISSVINQTSNDYELIIVDGLSTDGGIEYLQQFKEDKVNIIIEKDTGIYNAMNKGIKASKGKYLIFMNSGDTFHDITVLEKAKDTIHKDTMIAVGLSAYQTKKSIMYPPKNPPFWNWFLYNGIRHQSAFIARDVFNSVGLYNEKNRIVSDHEFFLLAIGIKRLKYQPLDLIVSSYQGGGISGNTEDSYHRKEFDDIFSRHIPTFVLEHYKANESLLKGGRIVRWFTYLKNKTTGKYILFPLLGFLYYVSRLFNKQKNPLSRE